MRFSERHGYKPVRDAIQYESMDEDLRHSLWNVLDALIWSQASESSIMSATFLSDNPRHRALAFRIWANFFKKPIDSIGDNWTKVVERLRQYFYEAEWYEVYDFVEFISGNYDAPGFRDEFMDHCNGVLEREKAAYRFIDGVVAPITDREELDSIDSALARPHDPVKIHLQRSVELLSDRKDADYRNSMKESILAVEAIVMKTTGSKGTLGQLIKKLEDEIKLHPALRSAFSNLYGFTSDQGGIRHALLEAPNVDFSDAKLMLVLCSAFINFVDAKLGLESK